MIGNDLNKISLDEKKNTLFNVFFYIKKSLFINSIDLIYWS
jgi:hypothetical protein